ncbi:transposase family protein [Kitasatospora purpeofusca]|uniref:transposase family protein n=1 Tax=Kitasatospora purpeofusca TaxID=67352 RepID=UPI0033DD251D
MCRQSATACLVKRPAPGDVAGLSLAERLRLLPDPRRRRGVRHPLVAVLLVSASAVVAGARSYEAIRRPVLRATADARPNPADTAPENHNRLPIIGYRLLITGSAWPVGRSILRTIADQNTSKSLALLLNPQIAQGGCSSKFAASTR